MSDLLARRLADGFAQGFGGAPSGVVRAPGRVNLIGDHTDYNDGLVLPIAIARETRVAWRATGTRQLRVIALDAGREQDAFAIGPEPSRIGGWRDYVRGTVDAAYRRGLPLAGAELAIAGDIPQGSGLSSSASLEIALLHALAAAAGARNPASVELALAAQDAENAFVGTRCGIMDQLVIAAAQPDTALLIDCRSLDSVATRLPPDWAVLIVQSGVTRGLVEGAYNLRRAQCEEAAAALGIKALRDAREPDLDRLEPLLRKRAQHVVTENARVVEARDALLGGDLAALGSAMGRSHASLRDDFEVSHPQVDRLVALLQSVIGSEGGARMTGGGFGGAVVAVFARNRADAIRAQLTESWENEGMGALGSFLTDAMGGAGSL